MTPMRPTLFSPYDAPMWDSIQAGALRLQRCSLNGRFRYPPGPVDPDTLSAEFTWEQVSGRATLLSWTTFHRQYLPAFPAPHTAVVIRLEEGPIMVSFVEQAFAAVLVMDGPVTLVYGDHPDGYRITMVRPVA